MNRLLGKVKNMWRSWTIWFNGVGIAIIGFWPDLVSNFPTLQGYVSEGVFKGAMGAILMINLILRFKTTKDLADKSAPKV